MYHDKKHQPGQGQDRSELASSSIVIITYNIHSAMSDSRLEAIEEELSDIYWVILVLVETWRPERFEKFVTEAGNMFYGSGGIRGRCGVGFLVHQRHPSQRFVAVNARLGVLTVRLGILRLQVIGIYMPDSTYPDEEIEMVYEQLEHILGPRRPKNHTRIIAGDFNAEVGPQDLFDDPAIIGAGGINNRNVRGDWLVQWCTLHAFVLGNTHFENDYESTWTYRNGIWKKQLDYILFEKSSFSMVQRCGTQPEIDTGSDHRSVSALFVCRTGSARPQPARQSSRNWNIDRGAYITELDSLLAKNSPLPSSSDTRCNIFAETLCSAGVSASRCSPFNTGHSDPFKQQIRELIQQRRDLQNDPNTEPSEKQRKRREICKMIQSLLRKVNRLRKRKKIDNILQEFRGLKEIAGIKAPRQKTNIEAMLGHDGNEITDKQGIADVFAVFYEKLYSSCAHRVFAAELVGNSTVDVFLLSELKDALKLMKRGKAKDETGLIAEMIKDASEGLLIAILDLFNDVLTFRETPPAEWKNTKLTVIFKKNDARLPGNYRPIAIIPILYKLFSRMLCKRLLRYIMPAQGVEQAAYRKGFSTEDHLLTITQLIEKSREHNFPVWIALVDFEKAFDTVEHGSLWTVLQSQGVPDHYISLLEKLYTGLVATVSAGVRSRPFPVLRGVKQGDPISALLFIAVMQACFDELQLKWKRANARRKGNLFGISFPLSGELLTNLRFADDVIIVAQSRVDVQKMLADLAAVSAKFGLKMNFSKTRVLTWDVLAGAHTSVAVGSDEVPILKEHVAEKYLGRKLAFADCQETELQNRIAAGWAAFHKHKQELCSKFYRLQDRAKLFDAVVGPAVLYACGTWALTVSMERKLRTVRRRMLRYVFRIHRKKDQEWVEYMQTSAALFETMAAKLEMTDWVHLHRRRKWRLAGSLARCDDARWSRQILEFKPDFGCGRSVGRPKRRWADQLEAFAGGDWLTVAADAELWKVAEDVFVHGA